jgi:predicted TIM-barrel fold metal-dependent hydrolase
MLFDINTATGHWPFRQIPNENISELKTLLTDKGITKAAVVNTNGVFYKNCHDANLELANQISKYPDFFTGIATLNPLYPKWEKDLQDCSTQLKMKGLRLVPQYHNYNLNQACAIEIVTVATELNIPIFIPSRLVDVRQRHWMDTQTTLTVDEIGALSLIVPNSRIVITECYVYPSQLKKLDGTIKYPNLYFEISRLSSAYGQEIAQIAELIGQDHLLFGTGAPFKEITSALIKLNVMKCPEHTREQISYQNAQKLFNIN